MQGLARGTELGWCQPLLDDPPVLSCAIQQQRTKIFSAQHIPDLSYVFATCKTEGWWLF